MKAGPVVRSIQIPGQVGDIAPSPHEGLCDGQQAEGGGMAPVKVPFQGLKKLVKRRGIHRMRNIRSSS
jgi:hypothetical protein